MSPILYPTRRVVICFTLCPALPGPSFVSWVSAQDVAAGSTDLIYVIPGMLYLGLASSIIGVIMFGIPSFAIAAIYATMRLTKTFTHIVFVVLTGGVAAMGWSLLTPFSELSSLAFLLGSATSFVMALYALPKPDRAN